MNIHTKWQDGRATMQNGAPSLRTNEQASLREVALAELQMSSLPQKHVEVGTMIMHPDAATDALYFIIAGRIRLYRLAMIKYRASVAASGCMIMVPAATCFFGRDDICNSASATSRR